MLDRNIIEQAYCFFHQKWRVYEFSTSESQKDDIEYAISSYVDGMSSELYEWLAEGKTGFLKEHSCFPEDIQYAIEKMEGLI